MSEILKDYCTTTEAAELLGVQVNSVINLIKLGRIKGEKVGNSWLVRRASIEEYYRKKRPSGRHATNTPKLTATAK